MITRTKEEMVKLVDETVEYYSHNPRSIHVPSQETPNYGSRCKYYLNETTGCAVGRLIQDKDLCVRLDDSTNTSVGSKHIFPHLPPEVQSYGAKFLTQLQVLHDSDHYWDMHGITESGKQYAELTKGYIEKGTFHEVSDSN